MLIDDPTQRAFWPILDAIEDGLDVEGLAAADRGFLARMHATLGRFVGKEPLTVPVEWATSPGTAE